MDGNSNFSLSLGSEGGVVLIQELFQHSRPGLAEDKVGGGKSVKFLFWIRRVLSNEIVTCDWDQGLLDYCERISLLIWWTSLRCSTAQWVCWMNIFRVSSAFNASSTVTECMWSSSISSELVWMTGAAVISGSDFFLKTFCLRWHWMLFRLLNPLIQLDDTLSWSSLMPQRSRNSLTSATSWSLVKFVRSSSNRNHCLRTFSNSGNLTRLPRRDDDAISALCMMAVIAGHLTTFPNCSFTHLMHWPWLAFESWMCLTNWFSSSVVKEHFRGMMSSEQVARRNEWSMESGVREKMRRKRRRASCLRKETVEVNLSAECRQTRRLSPLHALGVTTTRVRERSAVVQYLSRCLIGTRLVRMALIFFRVKSGQAAQRISATQYSQFWMALNCMAWAIACQMISLGL